MNRAWRCTQRVFSAFICTVVYHWQDFKFHLEGPDLRIVLEKYDGELRSKIKYTDEEGSYEEARDMLWKIMDESGLSGLM